MLVTLKRSDEFIGTSIEPQNWSPTRSTRKSCRSLPTFSVGTCDRIRLLGWGRLVESGTHESLLARQGLYASLHAQQLPQCSAGRLGLQMCDHAARDVHPGADLRMREVTRIVHFE